MRVYLPIILLLLLLNLPSPALAGSIPAVVEKDRDEILEVINTWLAQSDSPLAGRISIFLDSHEGNTLRVRMIPEDPQLGPVMDGYLRWQPGPGGAAAEPTPGELGGQWRVLAFREIYSPRIYDLLDIPESLRDPVQPLHFFAPDSATVETVRQLVAEALQIRVSPPVETLYEDVVTQKQGLSARFTFQNQGPVIPDPQAAMEIVRREMIAHDWQPVPHYSADSERGVLGAFSQGAVRLHLRIGWSPAQETPVPGAEEVGIYVPPDQRVYYLVADVIDRSAPGNLSPKVKN